MATRSGPLYVSEPTAKSLWQEYRLYADRIELDSHLFGTVTVPLDDVKNVALRPKIVIFDVFRGDYGLAELMRSPKLDTADLHQHVAIEKETGFWRQFRVTPDDPEAFAAACRKALDARAAQHPRRAGGDRT